MWAASLWLGWILTDSTVDMINALGFGVIRIELAVRDRPGRRSAAEMFNLAKIFFPQTEERGSIEFRVTANVIIGVRMQFCAVCVTPKLLRVVAAMRIHLQRVQFSFSRGTNGPRSINRIFL